MLKSVPKNSNLRANGSFEILKPINYVNSMSLVRVTNENEFPQTIFDKRLYESSEN